MAENFLDNIGKHFSEELEIEGNLALNSKMTIQILRPISTQKIIQDIYETESNHDKIFTKFRYELTYKFMKKIYESLTVNFDHIFAILLFMIPKKRIKKEYLKRLIYLAIYEIKQNCMLYDSDLDNNLINLISYETFTPFEEILSIAKRDGIIVEEEDELLISKGNLLDNYTHHTIRIKNIIKVILNEVLVIDKVKLITRNLIKLTQKQTEKRILDLLTKEELKEFEEDRAKFIEDVKPKEIGEPYFLEDENSNECVIALHGFSSAPREVISISEYLNRKGLNVYAPRLKGHGTSAKDLRTTTWQQWYDSVSRAITIASIKYEKIHLLGFSTGGLLALLSTKKQTEKIQSIICINAALRLNDIRMRTLLPTISFWNDFVESFNADKYAKEYIDNISENPEVNYDKHYIDSIEQLSSLMKKTRKHLSNVEKPIYIIQAKEDPVVNPLSAYEIFDNIKSENKDILILNLNRHIIIKGNDTGKLFSKIFKFIKKQGD